MMVGIIVLLSTAAFAIGIIVSERYTVNGFEKSLITGTFTNDYVVISKTNSVGLSNYTYNLKWSAVRETNENILFRKP